MNALSTKKDPNDPCDAEYTVGMSHEQIDAYHARRAAIRLLTGYVKPRVEYDVLSIILSIIGCTIAVGAFLYVNCMVLIILFGGK